MQINSDDRSNSEPFIGSTSSSTSMFHYIMSYCLVHLNSDDSDDNVCVSFSKQFRSGFDGDNGANGILDEGNGDGDGDDNNDDDVDDPNKCEDDDGGNRFLRLILSIP